MSNILEMQSFDTEQTPEADSTATLCTYTSHYRYISLALCWIK